MAKPDLFRILGCVALVTLILVIAVKMSKQCMRIPAAPVKARGSASPSSSRQGDGACKDGFRPDENGFCVQQ
jgi:hypothetical protein